MNTNTNNFKGSEGFQENINLEVNSNNNNLGFLCRLDMGSFSCFFWQLDHIIIIVIYLKPVTYSLFCRK